MLDDTDGRREPQRERLRVVELGGVVGDHAAVRASRDVAQPHGAQPLERRGEPELEELERYGRREPLDELVRRDDDDEAIGCRCHGLLPRVGTTAALDEPSRRCHLIGAVDRDVQPSERLRSGERLDLRARAPRAASSVAGDVATQRSDSPRRCERGQQIADRRSRCRGRPASRPRRAPPPPRLRHASRRSLIRGRRVLTATSSRNSVMIWADRARGGGVQVRVTSKWVLAGVARDRADRGLRWIG